MPRKCYISPMKLNELQTYLEKVSDGLEDRKVFLLVDDIYYDITDIAEYHKSGDIVICGAELKETE